MRTVDIFHKLVAAKELTLEVNSISNKEIQKLRVQLGRLNKEYHTQLALLTGDNSVECPSLFVRRNQQTGSLELKLLKEVDGFENTHWDVQLAEKL